MAWTTALGDDLDGVWQRLLAGETGMTAVPHAGRLRNDQAAVVTPPALDLPAAERLSEIAVGTVRRALAAAGREAAGPEIHLVLGTSFGTVLEDSPPEESARCWADKVAAAVGSPVHPIVVSTACSAGSDAVLVGAELIRAGLAACCVCGGVDVLTWSKRVNHSALGTMSPTTLRAFDVRHDGTLLGEGAGVLVLEGAAPAQEPWAVVRGAGSASDAAGMTAPDTTGVAARYAIERSLAEAGLSPGDVGIISAHASGTPLNDTTEREAFRAVFAPHGKALVFGTKGNFGHSLGATGALEAIALVLALRAGQVPPVSGLEQPDPEFPLRLPCGEAVRCDARVGLSLTLGFGGFDTSLVFEACE
jgi:3-oxoacyl-[acyl-carrier-protein] synthase II